MTKRNTSQFIRTFVAASFTAGVLSAAGLTISSPPDGTAAAPGSTVTVSVTPGGTFSQVTVVGEGSLGFSKVLTAAPYTFNMTLPANLPPGSYQLTALGVSAGATVSSTPVTLSVEPAIPPVQFDVQPALLNVPAGQRVPLRVIGTFADGSKLDITRSRSILFASSDTTVVAVDPQGNVTGVGPGSAQIIVNNALKLPVTVPQTLIIQPFYPVVYASQSTQLSVFQSGGAPLVVNWSINPSLGKISNSGLYTAPNQVSAQTVVVATATPKNDPTKTISMWVVLFPPVTVTITNPGPIVLQGGQSVRLIQLVGNALDQEVDWSIPANAPGMIDNTGLYTAPATIKAAQAVTVTATSIADSTKKATASIQLQP